MTNLVSKAWWVAAAERAIRTALVVAIPYIPASYIGQVPYLSIFSAALLAAILSLLTSLAGLPEVAGKQPVWWFAITERVVKTVAQAAVTAVGNAVLFGDVHWVNVGQIALTAGFGSLLLAFLRQLPEADVPLAQAVSQVVHTNASGAETQQSLPYVAPIESAPVPEAPAQTATASHRADTVAVPVVAAEPATKESINDAPRA